ncbi:MAG: hypothetical protein IPH03_19190 [Tetrasphaera sp.]|nr:hypothetical protein [Tetrasphaera sp.]
MPPAANRNAATAKESHARHRDLLLGLEREPIVTGFYDTPLRPRRHGGGLRQGERLTREDTLGAWASHRANPLDDDYFAWMALVVAFTSSAK